MRVTRPFWWTSWLLHHHHLHQRHLLLKEQKHCLSLAIVLHETISWWTVNKNVFKNHITQENAMFNITLTRIWINSQIFCVSWLSNFLLYHWNAVLCTFNQLKNPVYFVGFREFWKYIHNENNCLKICFENWFGLSKGFMFILCIL